MIVITALRFLLCILKLWEFF